MTLLRVPVRFVLLVGAAFFMNAGLGSAEDQAKGESCVTIKIAEESGVVSSSWVTLALGTADNSPCSCQHFTDIAGIVRFTVKQAGTYVVSVDPVWFGRESKIILVEPPQPVSVFFEVKRNYADSWNLAPGWLVLSDKAATPTPTPVPTCCSPGCSKSKE